MRRIIAGGEIRLVTRKAVTRRACKHVIDVARRARKRRMRPRQRVAGEFKMVEFGIEPGVHGVAGFAGGRKARRRMVDHRSPEILLMTRVTGD